MRYLLVIAALSVTACSGNLLPTCDGTTNCWAARCTDYSGTTGGLMTNTSLAADGRQVTFYGPVPAGVTVDPEDCQVTVETVMQ